MKKDAYYFPHDANAKDDPKCVMLIEQLGMEGYGIYWMLIETLRDQPGYRYPIALVSALARRFNTQVPKVEAVISNYGLFQIEGLEFFFSASLDRRMAAYDDKRSKARLAGQQSAIARKQLSFNEGSTSAQHPFNVRSTTVQPEEERREEEKREEDINIDTSKPPKDPPISKAKNIDYQKHINDFHAICTDLPQITKLSDKRKRTISKFISEYTEPVLVQLFQKVAASDFLSGRTHNDRNWRSDFDWILDKDHPLYILEGKWDNFSKSKGSATPSRSAPKPNKFHNFEQTMGTMSEDDLEAIVRRKEEKRNQYKVVQDG